MAYTVWNHKNVLRIAIRAPATPCHFLIWMGTVGQWRDTDYHDVFVLKYDFNQWARQRIHNTLIVVDRYMQLMWDKMIPDSAEPYLELFCLVHPDVRDKRRVSEINLSQPRHETAYWWRHNGSVTSQLTDPIKWPNYPLELIGIMCI